MAIKDIERLNMSKTLNEKRSEFKSVIFTADRITKNMVDVVEGFIILTVTSIVNPYFPDTGSVNNNVYIVEIVDDLNIQNNSFLDAARLPVLRSYLQQPENGLVKITFCPDENKAFEDMSDTELMNSIVKIERIEVERFLSGSWYPSL